jgi:hypothetical protein
MRIRRLARDALFITVAVMVLGGFSTGIAGAASSAPTNSTVTSSSAIHKMLGGCKTPAVCTFDVGIHGIILLQRFSCRAGGVYSRIINPIYQILNACPTRVYYFNRLGGPHYCLNPHSNQAGVGRFGTVKGLGVSGNKTKCP